MMKQWSSVSGISDGTLFSIILLHEVVTPRMIMGSIIIFISIIYLHFKFHGLIIFFCFQIISYKLQIECSTTI